MIRGEPGRKLRGGLYGFAVDPRIELLALAVKAGAFASSNAGVLARLVLEHGPPPDFAPGGVTPGMVTLLGGPSALRELIAGLRAFAEETDFAAYAKRSRPAWAACERAAWRESRGTLSVSAAEDWLAARFRPTTLIVSPLLPPEFGVNVRIGERELRVRGQNGEGAPRFEFDAFDACPAHELVHTVTNDPVLAHWRELDRYRALFRPDAGCQSNWQAYVIEEVALAVTLRVLRLTDGAKACRAQTSALVARGYTGIDRLCRILAGFETSAARRAGFAAFFPRVLAHYRRRAEGKR